MTRRGGEWLRLGDAARLLGVDPDTLRRWADSGKVEVFRTPGGHRRFPRAAIEALIPAPPRRGHARSLAAMGAPVDRLAAEFRRRVQAEIDEAPVAWTGRLDEEDRAAFRARGREASRLILQYLNATRRAEREHLLAQAERIGRVYGSEAARKELSLGETVQALLFFRTQFMAELGAVARRRDLDAAQATTLLAEAERAFDRLLLALVGGHQNAGRA